MLYPDHFEVCDGYVINTLTVHAATGLNRLSLNRQIQHSAFSTSGASALEACWTFRYPTCLFQRPVVATPPLSNPESPSQVRQKLGVANLETWSECSFLLELSCSTLEDFTAISWKLVADIPRSRCWGPKTQRTALLGPWKHGEEDLRRTSWGLPKTSTGCRNRIENIVSPRRKEVIRYDAAEEFRNDFCLGIWLWISARKTRNTAFWSTVLRESNHFISTIKTRPYVSGLSVVFLFLANTFMLN